MFPGTASRMAVKQEKVLVVPSKCLWDRLTYADRGLITGDVSQLPGLVAGCGRFVDRSEAENEPALKQIIPYAVVRHLDSYFCCNGRARKASKDLTTSSPLEWEDTSIPPTRPRALI
jgi:predicted NUDIX family phosphoesterase